MATLEDKILGNRLENYCSSSEDETGYEDAEANDGGAAKSFNSGGAAASPAGATDPSKTYLTPVEKWSGQSANTGPKGVIKDWQRFKQLETERNEEKERERIALMKKLSITATTTSAEDAARSEQDALDAELAELLGEDDGVLMEFQRRRMVEMMERTGQQPLFGRVVALTDSVQFLDAVDKEHRLTTIVVHVHEPHLAACRTMDGCLEQLADEYRQVKFCKILGSVAGLSRSFKVGGVPALLVYKAGQLIGNFVRVSDDLGGEDFYGSDVESFLIEHGMLPDKTHAPSIIGSASGGGGDNNRIRSSAKKCAAAAESSDDD